MTRIGRMNVRPITSTPMQFPSTLQHIGDQPGGDQPGGDQPGGDQPGGDQPGGDQPGGDQPGGDQPGGDQPGGDQRSARLRNYLRRPAVSLESARSASSDEGAFVLVPFDQ